MKKQKKSIWVQVQLPFEDMTATELLVPDADEVLFAMMYHLEQQGFYYRQTMTVVGQQMFYYARTVSFGPGFRTQYVTLVI